MYIVVRPCGLVVKALAQILLFKDICGFESRGGRFFYVTLRIRVFYIFQWPKSGILNLALLIRPRPLSKKWMTGHHVHPGLLNYETMLELF